jgi:hypothetical protein
MIRNDINRLILLLVPSQKALERLQSQGRMLILLLNELNRTLLFWIIRILYEKDYFDGQRTLGGGKILHKIERTNAPSVIHA